MKYCNTGIINCKDCWDWDKDRCKVGLHNPNDKVAIAIAARDKWWVERIERRVIDNCLSLDVDPEHCLVCEKAGACYIESWQSLKKEAGYE
jgi:hypothetical protein